MSTHTPVRTAAGFPSPSTSFPSQSRTPYSSHIPAEHPGKDGNVELFAVVVPATDLLSGNGGTLGIVLELASFDGGFGPRHTIVNWHGPFPTPQEASDFVAQLAEQKTSREDAPTGGRKGRNV